MPLPASPVPQHHPSIHPASPQHISVCSQSSISFPARKLWQIFTLPSPVAGGTAHSHRAGQAAQSPADEHTCTDSPA